MSELTYVPCPNPQIFVYSIQALRVCVSTGKYQIHNRDSESEGQGPPAVRWPQWATGRLSPCGGVSWL